MEGELVDYIYIFTIFLGASYIIRAFKYYELASMCYVVFLLSG